jgi:transposase
MTGKAKRAQYTLEFKLEAVRLVKAGQSMAAVAATLGVVEQTLYNWVKADREGRLAGAGTKPVSPEQMELARLRAEVARLKMERDVSYGLFLQAERVSPSLPRSQMSTYPT